MLAVGMGVDDDDAADRSVFEDAVGTDEEVDAAAVDEDAIDGACDRGPVAVDACGG